MKTGGTYRSDKRPARVRAASVAAVLFLSYGGGVLAATLSVTHATANDGLIAVAIAVKPESGESVAGAQFELLVDSGSYEVHAVIAGEAALGAGKDVAVGTHSDAITVLVAGFNQNAMSEGTLATIYLVPLGSSTGYPPAITAAVLSDPYGKQIPVIVPPVPKTEDPPADGDASPDPQTPLPAPAVQPAVPANNRELNSHVTGSSGFTGALDYEETAVADLIGSLLPLPYAARRIPANATARAFPGAPATRPAVRETGTLGRESTAHASEWDSAPQDAPAGNPSTASAPAQHARLAHVITPLTITDRAAAPSGRAPSALASENGPAAALEPSWKKPVLFLMVLAIIAGGFPLRRKLFGKGRY